MAKVEHSRDGFLSLAMASVLFDLARNKLPIFYCVDPYIPHFADKTEFGFDIPYSQRHYIDELRTEGCHRIVLVEEIAKAFVKVGVKPRVVELNSTFETSRVL